jgi:tetratricopeptide (TPR) repeat protein
LSFDRLDRAWRAPAEGLGERIERVRAAADALGIPDIEPLARALVIDSSLGSLGERSEAAIRLAPRLPAARLARAEAAWRENAGVGKALRATHAALRALPGHVESRLWLEATALTLGFVGVLGASLAWIAVRGLWAATQAGHDLFHRIGPGLPAFAKAASIATLILLPAALGEGPIGVGLVLFALAWWAGDGRQRRALVAAASLVWIALGPLAGAAGRALGSFSADPVVFAAIASERGWIDPADALRLERASAAGDPLATQVLARRARRAGDLPRARALLDELLEDPRVVTPSLLDDAAQVRLAAGDVDRAVELYRRAIALQPSADLWFNLAQAHVRAIDMDSHAAALAAAQALDPARTSTLTQRMAGSDVTRVDLPLDAAELRKRLRRTADPAIAAALRAPVAPGLLGTRIWAIGLCFAALAAGAGALARVRAPSRLCRDCAARLCAHCRSGNPSDGLCAACARRRLEARHGGPWEPRGERRGGRALLAWLARHAGLFLPGLVEAEPRRPGRSLAALTALVLAGVFWVGRSEIIADPAAVGAAGSLVLALLAGALLASAVGLDVWAHRRGTL